MESEKARRGWKRAAPRILAVVLFLALLLTAASFAFSQFKNKIVDSAVSSMAELAAHDEMAISASLNTRWDLLDNMARSLRQKRCKTTNELGLELNSSWQLLECIRLSLLAGNGDALNSDMTLSSSPELLQLCESSGDRFVYRLDRLTDAAGSGGKVLIMGVRITPFTVEDRRYQYILCRIDVNTIQGELRIDSYAGRGFSSVIDLDGNYIVNVNQGTGASDNFFTELSASRLEGALSLEDIRSRVAAGNDFFISHTNSNGETWIEAFTPMPEIGWTFIMSVPMAVFEEQSLALTQIFVVLLGATLAVVLVLSVFLFQRRNKLLDIEIQHRKELTDALILAEQASRAKTSFLNNMSHDIRTPMNAIIGFTSLARSHIDDKERVRDYLAKISQSSNHLLSLINDVLDMSRIESGKVSIEEGEESLAEILHGLRDMVQADIRARNQTLTIDAVDVSDEAVLCDRLRLNQILLNILSNAVKFTPAGGSISLVLTQRPSPQPDTGRYEFRIKDTGIGMSQEFLKTIFEPFTRERNSTVSGIQGTGLGMAITKNIVDMMGGHIEVSSQPGEGTEFTVTLDLKLCGKAPEPLPALAGLRCLLVGDDEASCRSLAGLLDQLGLRTDWTPDSGEAAARIADAAGEGQPYALYVLDLREPGPDGLELARQLRRQAGGEAPLLLVSSSDWAEVKPEASAAGVSGFIARPVFLSDLRRALSELQGQSAPDAAEASAGSPGFAGKRILLVEDNELNQEIATEILTEAGFEVDTAGNGLLAFETVRDAAPGYFDLVLMDVQMPVMDGYAATRAIRALPDPGKAGVPIIAMTANAFEEDKNAAAAAGMDGHVGKPVDISILMRTLSDILNK